MTQETSWTVLRAAADGDEKAHSVFARSYLPVVRAYLIARWKGSALSGEVEDAVQNVFVECFRSQGVIQRADPQRSGGFRAFLLGTARNVAANMERARDRRLRRIHSDSLHPERIETDETHLSEVFDRAWARALVREAAARMRDEARAKGSSALRRVEILRLRFQEGLPIREIATRLGREPARTHHDYALARKDFRGALERTVSFHSPGSKAFVDRECERLLALLG